MLRALQRRLSAARCAPGNAACLPACDATTQAELVALHQAARDGCCGFVALRSPPPSNAGDAAAHCVAQLLSTLDGSIPLAQRTEGLRRVRAPAGSALYRAHRVAPAEWWLRLASLKSEPAPQTPARALLSWWTTTGSPHGCLACSGWETLPGVTPPTWCWHTCGLPPARHGSRPPATCPPPHSTLCCASSWTVLRLRSACTSCCCSAAAMLLALAGRRAPCRRTWHTCDPSKASQHSRVATSSAFPRVVRVSRVS